MRTSGWIKEPLSFKSYDHHKLYGSAQALIPTEITRDISAIPFLYQGKESSCVSCSVAWIKQWYEAAHPSLSWEYLAQEAGTSFEGATPTAVLEPARKTGICTVDAWKAQIEDEITQDASKHKINGYAYLTKYDVKSLYQALLNGPIMVGVDDWRGAGPHMMVAYGLEADLKTLKGVSWWKEDGTEEVGIQTSDVVFACSFFTNILDAKPVVNPMTAVASKAAFYAPIIKEIVRFFVPMFAAFLALVWGLHTSPSTKPAEPVQQFGSAGVYDSYAPAVAGAGQTATQNTLPVTSFSLTDGSGGTVTTSSIRFPAYLTVNPKSTTDREVEECNGLDSVGVNFINCNRAITCNNTNNTTSTISGGAYAHPAGEPVILSNNNCFFNRFVDTFTNQDNVGGVKKFTATSVQLGDNTTGTVKQIFFRVGQSLNPYFKVVGPASGNTTSSFYFSQDGSSDLQLNASGTTVGASSTASMQIVNGLQALVVSTTQGLLSDNTNGNGALVIIPSSTDSNNGGFLNFTTSTNALGRLFWDIRAFVAKAITWTGNHIFNGTVFFNGNVTSTGSFQVATPTSTMDAANKGYVDISVSQDVATGTAGVAISPGNTLYVSTTGTLFLASALAPAANMATGTAYSYVGISLGTYTNGQTVQYVKPGGIADNQTGLSAGKQYYLSNTAGAVSLTPGGVPVRIGVALTATRLQLFTPSFRGRTTGSTSLNFDGSTSTVVTNFVPTRIDFQCGNAATHSIGWFMVDSSGGKTQRAIGADSSSAGNWIAGPYGCDWKESTNEFRMIVATTTNGFTLGTNNLGTARTVFYSAETDDTIFP